MKEDFIVNVQFDLFTVQNIQFDLFTVELVIGETATLLMAENYVDEEIKKLLPLIYAGL